MRLPITPAILRQIRASLLRGSPSINDIMLWVAATTCFFVFFRTGEMTVPPRTASNPAVHLAWGNVSSDDSQPPTMLRVFLEQSKTDQFGCRVDVYLGAMVDDLYPVAAILAFMVNHGSAPGPFFQLVDGTPLSKVWFVAKIRDALACTSIPHLHHVGHSFHIKAAMAAVMVGVLDLTIQALGGWSSTAFWCYIQTPREQLAQLSQTIVRAP